MRQITGWQWFRNMVVPGSNPSTGAYLYGEGDQLKVRQANGLTFAVAPQATVDAGTWSGGNAGTVFTGQPLIRCGGAS